MAEWYKKNRSLGLCVNCGNHSFGFKLCPKCKEKNKERFKKNQSDGMCVCCGKKRESRKHYCDKCSERINSWRRIKKSNNKKRAVELLGGKCSRCGLVSEIHSIYDFHHIDPSNKELNIGENMISWTWEKTESEVKKCVLLCANCHRIEHYLIRTAVSNG